MHCESFALEPKCESAMSENAEVKKWVGQGFLLSPLLFTSCAEAILSETLL